MKSSRRVIFIKFLFVSLLTCLAFSQLMGQTDTEFWFVVPEVFHNHGDEDINLTLTTYSDPVVVTISKPADPSFSNITRNILQNSTIKINLTSRKSQLENIPEDMVLNQGLLIQSTAYITAYYEVASWKNPEIFSLKGRNALGTLFYIPSQNFYDNATNYVPDPTLIYPDPISAFDIVATEDNTHISIIPSQNYYNNHLAGDTVEIILNRGQTYSVRADTNLAANHLMGSVVISDKPIAITYKDDSLDSGLCADLIGDQIIPYKSLSTIYVVVRGELSIINDRVFIISTANNNNIYLDGQAVPATTLDAGETYAFEMPPEDSVVYINSDYPTTVLHLTGFFCELGGSVMPGILSNCNGSSNLAFTRAHELDFMIMLITTESAKDSFLLDGSPHFNASEFHPVPGSTDLVYGRFLYPDVSVIDTGAHRVSNSAGTFHLGILNLTQAGTNLGAEYGYFSDYVKFVLPPDTVICADEPFVLSIDSTWNTYSWNTGDTTHSIMILGPGVYSVTVTSNECVLSDSIVITLIPSPDVTVTPADTTICDGDSVTLYASGVGLLNYQWSTGGTNDTIIVKTTGTYSIQAWNRCANPAMDTALVTVSPNDTVTITITNTPSLDTICENTPVTFTAHPAFEGSNPIYYWHVNGIHTGPDDTVFTYSPIDGDTITCWMKSSQECVVNDSVRSNEIILSVLPWDTARISIVAENPACENTQVTFSATTENGGSGPIYYWQVNSSNVGTNAPNYTYLPLDGDTVRCWLKSNERCVVSDSVLSNEIIMEVMAWESVNVSIVVDSNPACTSPAGPVVTFTATPSYGGVSPAYEWFVDGMLDPTSNTDTFTMIPLDNETIHCILHSNYLCPLDTPATSNPITMSVLPWETVTVDIEAITPECVGELVQFTATPTNGGSNPIYSWYVADTLVPDSISNTFSYNPLGNDIVTCIMTSSYLCPIGDPAISDTIHVLPWLPVTVTITASPASLCEGIPITFTADTLNGGAAPTFEWFVNGTMHQASGSVQFTYTPAGKDTICCVMLSNYTCPTDNPDTSNLIITNENPPVSLTPCNDLITTINAQPFLLKGGLPLGGIYSGPGVTPATGMFNPAAAGIGTIPITYTYIDVNTCTANTGLNIQVLPEPAFTCGQPMTDVRDNKIYPTVQLGTTCWMAANLNYGTLLSYTQSQRDNCLFEKYCYNNFELNCQSQGGLYQWDEMMQYIDMEGTQGFCPPGWHVPVEHEWEMLFAYFSIDSTNAVAGRYLKTNGGSGFDAQMEQILHFNREWNWNRQYPYDDGPWYSPSGPVYQQHSPLQATFFWSSTSSGIHKAWAHGMNHVTVIENIEFTPSVSYYSSSRNNAFYLRCVKD